MSSFAPTPFELRLVVGADPAAPADAPSFLARWQNGAGQDATAPFAFQPPCGPAELSELRWYLEAYMQFPGIGDRARAERFVPQLRHWGQALFAASFGTPQASHLLSAMQEAEERGHLCRITLGCDLPLVLQQPWELLHDQRGPLAFRGLTVRRQLPTSQLAALPLLAPPLRVLLIVSRPEDVIRAPACARCSKR